MTSFLQVTGFDPLVIAAAAGHDGHDGSPGTSIVNASVNAQNHLVLVLSNGANIDAGDITASYVASFANTFAPLAGQGATIGTSALNASGDITVAVTSPWGIRGDGTPYYDPAGAATGEAAVLSINPDTGAPRLTLIGA